MEDLELNFKFLYPAIVWDIKKSERYVQIFYIYQKRAWYQKVRPIHSEKIRMTSVLSKPFVCKKEMFCIWNLAETAQFRK